MLAALDGLPYEVTLGTHTTSVTAVVRGGSRRRGRHDPGRSPGRGRPDAAYGLHVPPGVEPLTAPFNHSPYAVFDDSVLTDAAALYAQLAISRLFSAASGREAAGG